jgi:glyoxylase-like metal-dependent hydrolase (beta-lactamase superfamily II)/8-oxo-dGTP pyrophosphatase MutT (NUDIX family)
VPATVPAQIRPSASLVVTRDGLEGPEILFCHRVSEMPSFPDFWAFPGGGVTRFDQAAAEQLPGFSADETGAALACLLREMVEEVGWAPADSGLFSVKHEFRSSVIDNGKNWNTLVESGDIPANPFGFSVISIRTTPPLASMRFTNRFFHFHDPNPPEPTLPNGRSEFDEMRWLTPQAALHAWENSEMRIPPPQISLLRDLITALEAANEKQEGLTTDNENNQLGQQISQTSLDCAIASLAANPPTGEHRIEFAPGVECVPLETHTLPPATHTNCYILGHPGGEHLVVDPAAHSTDGLAYLERRIRAAEADGGKVIATVFTHRHPDHIGDLAAISKIYQAPIFATAETHQVIPPCDTDKILVEGDKLTLKNPYNDTIWEVLETPGHCPGHICLASEVGIISGDLAVMVGTILVPPSDGDMDHYIASLKRLRDLNPPLLFPAHGPLSPVPEKLLTRYISHRKARHKKVLTAVKNRISKISKIADFAYSDTPEAHPILKVDQTLSHLRAHERNSVLHEVNGQWYAGPIDS